MKRSRMLFAALLFVLCFSVAACAGETRELVDMAGRHLVVPVKPQRVYSTNPIGTTLIYTIAPDQLMGWNYPLKEKEKHFLPEKYRNLPVIGGWYSTRKGNLEEIMTLAPDLFICMSNIDDTTVSFADKLQNQTGIPVVIASYELDELDKTYRFLGELLGEEKKAETLARYCHDTVAAVVAGAMRIPEDERVRVYYAEGPDGQRTDPAGSRHTQVLSMVGGINVAQVPSGAKAGMSGISMEQIHLWNPDLIISWGRVRGGYADGILEDSNWKELRAVRSGQVYVVPDTPFCWFDRPPSVNRVIGLKWLGNLLYPEVFDFDMVAEAREFYRLFWHYDLSEEEARDILSRSLRNR